MLPKVIFSISATKREWCQTRWSFLYFRAPLLMVAPQLRPSPQPPDLWSQPVRNGFKTQETQTRSIGLQTKAIFHERNMVFEIFSGLQYSDVLSDWAVVRGVHAAGQPERWVWEKHGLWQCDMTWHSLLSCVTTRDKRDNTTLINSDNVREYSQGITTVPDVSTNNYQLSHREDIH